MMPMMPMMLMTPMTTRIQDRTSCKNNTRP
jgi:hypothetical protein